MRRIIVLLCVSLLYLPLLGISQEKPRVFITDSKSWEISGGFGANEAAVAGHMRGGARPQTAEIIKTFGERCPDVTVNMRQERAGYVVLLDHEGAKAAPEKITR